MRTTRIRSPCFSSRIQTGRRSRSSCRDWTPGRNVLHHLRAADGQRNHIGAGFPSVTSAATHTLTTSYNTGNGWTTLASQDISSGSYNWGMNGSSTFEAVIVGFSTNTNVATGNRVFWRRQFCHGPGAQELHAAGIGAGGACNVCALVKCGFAGNQCHTDVSEPPEKPAAASGFMRQDAGAKNIGEIRINA